MLEIKDEKEELCTMVAVLRMLHYCIVVELCSSLFMSGQSTCTSPLRLVGRVTIVNGRQPMIDVVVTSAYHELQINGSLNYTYYINIYRITISKDSSYV